jgi:hypothetical protein
LNANTKFVVTFFFWLTELENLTIVDDATTSSNPSIAQVQDEKFEEALFDMIVSQQPRKK